LTTNTVIFDDHHNASTQLHFIAQLNARQLTSVVRHIATVTSGYDDDYPSWSPPIAIAGEAVSMLRKQLRPLGWTKQEQRGFELTISPCKRFALNIAKGTAEVGLNGPAPQTVSDKGPCSVLAIDVNQNSFDFMKTEAESTIVPNAQTWWLLYYNHFGTYRSELSLPIMMKDRKISNWRYRILLPEVSLTDPSGIVSAGTSASSTVDVPIKKKKR